MSHVNRRRLATATLASLLVLAPACGEDSAGEDPAPAPSSTSTGDSSERPEPTEPTASTEPAEPATTTIEVTIEGGAASTAGERVEVAVGEPVDLVITSDTAGELHVHTSPEQFLEFTEGANEPIELLIDRPGRVEIELHEPTEGPVVELLVQ